jgi:glucose/arabinose dehydrogenase
MNTLHRTLLFSALALFACLAAVTTSPARPDRGKPTPSAESESDYYQILTYTPPPGVVLESGAIEIMPDGKVAVGTRRGEIWMIDNAYDPDPKKAKFTRFAHGLHEILGLAAKDGWLYVVQRPDISRIKDANGDGKADLFEVVSDLWEVNGDYHEYAFGSHFDSKGTMWITLCLTGSFTSDSKFRGWAMKLTPDGKLTPVASGVRSPGGVGFNAQGDVFYTDNQGPWNGCCGLKHIVEGGFCGHPGGFKWYKEKEAEHLGPAPTVPKSNSRMMVEAKKIPQLVPTAVMFPYGKMGQSASGFDCDLSGGKFGPFEKQLFVGDQTHSTIMRATVEKINGHYQGACYPFRAGFASGIVPVKFARDGSLLVGGTNRGWGSKGPKPFAIERLVWTGKTPFEILEMKAVPDGFDISFTKPIDPVTAGKPSSYDMKTFTYVYRAEYGSPEVDATTAKVTKVVVAEDRKSVRLTVDGLQEGHIHDLTINGVTSSGGQALLHSKAYYTLNYIPTK